MSTKKMQKDYEDVKKYKKRIDKNGGGLNVEKIMEKKRKLQDEAKHTVLPTITQKGG
jgi:hypothetical protein